jgi:hypothetical protein|tara:strand:+ start:156 stop:350 length:195 start_codon:yes stop_codon:yes gene_type:complete
MTLPQNGKKLSKIEEESMEIALKEAGIRAIHPERMEALADSMVEKLKNTHEKPRPWRTGGALEE